MSIAPGDLRSQLLASDAEFQRLAREHLQYESQLEELTTSPYRSVEDELLEITLKKMKLRVKDAMEQRVAQVRRVASG